MELRPELSAPVVAPERIAELRRSIERVERLLDDADPADAAAAIAALNADTGHDTTPYDFHTYWTHQSVEAFALALARPVRPKVRDVTRDELVEVTRRIVEGDPADQEYYLAVLETNVVHPRVSDLIFHPPAELIDATPAEIVDAALAYKSTAM